LVRAAVAGLPAGQRVAVTLHYLAGLTQAETAERAGTSVGAVKVRLHKARGRLRERLGPWWREERMPVEETTGWVRMRVSDVRRGAASGELPERHVVVLEEVDGAAGQGGVDARPSDALTLALLTGAPIRVDPAVIDEAASRPFAWDQRLEELPAGAAEIVTERRAEWERTMAAFTRAREQGT
jgi:Sigma-70, region 4/Bifunctional nuclease domain